MGNKAIAVALSILMHTSVAVNCETQISNDQCTMHAANNLLQQNFISCEDWKIIEQFSSGKYEEVKKILSQQSKMPGIKALELGVKYEFFDKFDGTAASTSSGDEWIKWFKKAVEDNSKARKLKDYVNGALKNAAFMGFWISVRCVSKGFNHATVMTMKANDGNAYFLDSQYCPENYADGAISFSVKLEAPAIVAAITELVAQKKKSYADFRPFKIWVVMKTAQPAESELDLNYLFQEAKVEKVKITPNKFNEGCICHGDCVSTADVKCSCLSRGCWKSEVTANDICGKSGVKNAKSWTATDNTGFDTAKTCNANQKKADCVYTVDCSGYSGAHEQYFNEIDEEYANAGGHYAADEFYDGYAHAYGYNYGYNHYNNGLDYSVAVLLALALVMCAGIFVVCNVASCLFGFIMTKLVSSKNGRTFKENEMV